MIFKKTLGVNSPSCSDIVQQKLHTHISVRSLQYFYIYFKYILMIILGEFTVLTDLLLVRIAEQVVWTIQLSLAVRLQISDVMLDNLRYEEKCMIDVTFKLLKVSQIDSSILFRNQLCL